MFAQIDSGVITAVFEGSYFEINEPFVIRDITFIDPQPGIGWRYDGVAYSPPAEVAPAQAAVKTRYTHREFVLRLGAHYASIERLRDTNAALPPDQKNYDLARLFVLWDKAEFIDLLDTDLHAAFAVFVGLGLLTEADADKILTPDEEV